MTLSGTQPASKMVVDRQSCDDIIQRMLIKHEKTKGDYDMICGEFDKGSLYHVCETIFNFCKKNFRYKIEEEEKQYVSVPYTMLVNQFVDCKNYALFCAGILDALKRRGRKFHWIFRFANYDWVDALLYPSDVGHVFVVVNPNTDNIWVDPVMNEFNYHMWYWKKRDKRPRSVKGIGRIGGAVGSAEDDLLSSVKEYADGLSGAMNVTNTLQELNAISAGILKSIAGSLPGASQALAAINAGQVFLNNTFGAGSIESRLFADMQGNILLAPINIFKTIFKGRTYNTDQYWAAQYYKYYVLGQAGVTNINQVTDSDVIPALKWFIDRTGVFISGREHIIALTKGPAEYIGYQSVNADTTNDINRVNAACNVAGKYFVFGAPPGSWANTVGVYDQQVIAIANSTGLSVEQVAAQEKYQGVYSASATTGPNPVTGGGSNMNVILLAAAAVLIIVGLTD
jgi:hypothetical protein